jgi:uncharacterized protein (DUF433 family)
MEIWETPIYNPAYVSRLIDLSTGRIKRWLQGYEYRYVAGNSGQEVWRHKEPVIGREDSEIPNFASFLDLIDLLFVKQFLNKGISLQKIRKALTEAQELVGGHHFAQRMFFTDGKNIYMQVRDDADSLLELLSGGHWVISQFIKELAQQIEFDEPSGFATKWFPLGKAGLVVIDPKISFGRPTIVDKNISTDNIYDCFLGENENISKVCKWLDLTQDQVNAAVKFETTLNAA